MRLTLLTLCAALLLPACNDGEDDDDGGTIDPARIEAILALPGDVTAGEAVFARCAAASCHGPDGNSGSGSPLSDEVPDLSDEGLVDVVLGGEEAMPPQALTDQEMADVLAYLRETFG